ncbi:hypothetical protein PVAP13_9NG064458 [Panicum virgatum]|uniref:Nicotianamine synthase n=1 Tax=Panicum virgatum TaxID=38727 RepID=A0A8T0MGU8_PANVG|nr:hypothetical protein PVAP13_9NG064458 [Panicum virgatum]
MEAQNHEVAALVEKISGLHAAIAKLPSLSPSPAVDALFTALVAACVPASPVDVSRLGPGARKMREELIRLCSDAEGQLEAHHADALAAFDNPLDHLHRFPYYRNYVDLSRLEYDLLARHVPGLAPARVAFVGSGPLPFSSLVLAARHLPGALFDNYDWCAAANERAKKLVRADVDLRAQVVPHGRRRGPHGGARGVRRRVPGRTRGVGGRGQGEGGGAPRPAHGRRRGARGAERAGSCTPSWTPRASGAAGSTCSPCTTPTTRSSIPSSSRARWRTTGTGACAARRRPAPPPSCRRGRSRRPAGRRCPSERSHGPGRRGEEAHWHQHTDSSSAAVIDGTHPTWPSTFACSCICMCRPCLVFLVACRELQPCHVFFCALCACRNSERSNGV